MRVPVIQSGVFDLERGGQIPLAQQLYQRFRSLVAEGGLPPGTRLPSSRALAQELGVSRNTANAAYDLLKAEGILEVRQGAAPVVASARPLEGGGVRAAVKSRPVMLSQRGRQLATNVRGDSWPSERGALQPGTPALDTFPHDLWARHLRRAARRAAPQLLYEDVTGHPDLLQVIAGHVSALRGVRTEPGQIIVTSSTQASLSALSDALSDPGDTVWIEDPGYLGARAAFTGAGLHIRGMPVDCEGPQFAGLAGEGAAPKLIYTTPSHQYPFAGRMSLQRRLGLIECAARMNSLILEDDYDSEFLFEGRSIAALQGLAGGDQVIYLGTFAKSFLPGLRVAYCIVPKPLAAPLRAAFRNTGRVASVQVQMALASFLASGDFAAHLKTIRTVYQARGTLLVEAVREAFGDEVAVEMPTGNVQVVLRLQPGVDDTAVARAMQARGFAISPLSACYLEASPQPGLIVGFAAATDRLAAAFVRALRGCLNEAAAWRSA